MVWNKKIQQEARKNRLKGWLILSLTVFLSLSFFSYNPQDPSFNSFGLSLKVTNYCGFVGASLADLFYQLFGFSSWFFILGGAGLAYKFFAHRFYESLLSSFLFFGLFLLAFASLSELHFPSAAFFNEQVSLGGALGKMIIYGLKPLFHWTGTALLLWSALILVFIFYGPSLFSSFFLRLPKKTLFFGLLFLKKIPSASSFILVKGYKGANWVFFALKNFFRDKFLLIAHKFFKKGEKSAFKDPSSFLGKTENRLEDPSSSLGETENRLQDPSHFVFKEENSLKEDQSTYQESRQGEAYNIEPKEPRERDKSFIFSPPPSLDILSDSPLSRKKISRQDVEDLSKKLIDKLSQFAIRGKITAIKTGPALILFEFKPEDHIKVSKIREMESDLSLALSSESVRIIAPIPGRDVVGIEASMPYREMVYLKSLLSEESFFKARLPIVLGRRADNVIAIKDLARLPHLLVAGTTGSGKSMFIISFITSLLFRHSPETLRILLIDPKQVDLSAFKDIPHLLSPIITSADKTAGALQWAILEMEKRYRSLSLFKARDHQSFNSYVQNLSTKEKKLHFEKNESVDSKSSYYFEPLPLICLVIEEFGDLMADRNVRRPIENSVVRLAQKARASGIHLVLAMQSPRKDVVTGLIKTNIPGRISFKVASGTDSRVILDETGAERLLSHGDMLFLEPGHPKPLRYHGPFIREKDVAEIGNYWKSQSDPFYEPALIKGEGKNKTLDPEGAGGALNIKEDPMYDEILEFVKGCKIVSASFLQRKFRIGYPRAARIIEVLFEEGKIGPPQGSKPREVLFNK